VNFFTVLEMDKESALDEEVLALKTLGSSWKMGGVRLTPEKSLELEQQNVGLFT